MENILLKIDSVYRRLPKLANVLSVVFKCVALALVVYALFSKAYHCIFTGAMYYGLAWLTKHIND